MPIYCGLCFKTDLLNLRKFYEINELNHNFKVGYFEL